MNNEDFLIYQGDTLKALSDTGKVGGYLVLFNETDLQGDYFTSEQTDYWLEGKSLLPLLWAHGLDKTVGRKRLTHVYHSMHDQGLWIEGKLPLRANEVVDRIWDRVQKGEIGLSSGSAGHLVHREFDAARGANKITSWPITEGSLTPQPVQPRSRAVALKSLPLSDFEIGAPSPGYYEQKAMNEYVKLLQIQHELRMMGFRS